jgi:hypothetical protein
MQVPWARLAVQRLQLVLLIVAGWVNRRHLDVIEYLREEIRVLKGAPAWSSSAVGRRQRGIPARRPDSSAEARAGAGGALMLIGGYELKPTVNASPIQTAQALAHSLLPNQFGKCSRAGHRVA